MSFMAFSAFSRLVSLIAFITFADAYWIFGGTKPIIQERLDSVVDPGQVIIAVFIFISIDLSLMRDLYILDRVSRSRCRWRQ